MTSSYDYLILGGGIAGVTAAETIREKSPKSSIAIISEEPHLLYSRVLLPSYLKKRILRDKVFLRKEENFTNKNIDLRLGEKAVFVDTRYKDVGLSNRRILKYKKLLITTGGKVNHWNLGGPEADRFIYRLQTLDDADRLFNSLNVIKSPLVVGSSFISLEFLEIFFLNGALSTLMVRDPYFFSRIVEEQGGMILEKNFKNHGIKSHYQSVISGIEKSETLIVEINGSKKTNHDGLGLGIGLERNIDFLIGSEIALGKTGILTDEFLETNQRGVFAAGDVAEFYDNIFGKIRVVGNWNNAFLQGKAAGLNMVGEKYPFKNLSTYSITNLGMQITVLGDCEEFDKQIIRLDDKKMQYERWLMKNGALVGTALINRFQNKPHVSRLIENKTKIDMYEQKLKDIKFDIQNIPVIR